jgi:hypothetical protein
MNIYRGGGGRSKRMEEYTIDYEQVDGIVHNGCYSKVGIYTLSRQAYTFSPRHNYYKT